MMDTLRFRSGIFQLATFEDTGGPKGKWGIAMVILPKMVISQQQWWFDSKLMGYFLG